MSSRKSQKHVELDEEREREKIRKKKELLLESIQSNIGYLRHPRDNGRGGLEDKKEYIQNEIKAPDDLEYLESIGVKIKPNQLGKIDASHWILLHDTKVSNKHKLGIGKRTLDKKKTKKSYSSALRRFITAKIRKGGRKRRNKRTNRRRHV